MKKIIISLILVLGFSGVVFADTTTACGDPALSTASITYLACGNGPINYIMPWGNETTLPKVSTGQFVTDESGFKVWVPNFDYRAGWVDLTHTDYYRAQMRVLGADLVSKGITGQFPQFFGWFSK